MKYLRKGQRVRRKKPYFDSIFSRRGAFFKDFNTLEDYYTQVGTVIDGGDSTVWVIWNDGRKYKYGVSVLERIADELDPELFEI